MSLIDDALKRQEEIRRGIVPKAPVNEPPPPHDDAPRVDLRVRSVAPQSCQGVEQPPPRPAQTPASRRPPPPENPFLERERMERRRSNPNVILMPLLGLIVFLVLLLLRNEFTPPAEEPSRPVRTPLTDTAVVEDLFPNGPDKPDKPASSKPPTTKVPSPQPDDSTTRRSDDPTTQEGPASSGPPTAKVPSPKPDDSTTRRSDDPTIRRPDDPTIRRPDDPTPLVWPAFTLNGIAVGREKLAILNSGEMLQAGETAKCGVKVEKVNAATVVFSWKGETKTLRKGEQSDKPADTH